MAYPKLPRAMFLYARKIRLHVYVGTYLCKNRGQEKLILVYVEQNMKVCVKVSAADTNAQDTVVCLRAQVTAFSTYRNMHSQVCGVDVDMWMATMKSYGDIRLFSHEFYLEKIDSVWGVTIPCNHVSFTKKTPVIELLCLFACSGVFCML